MTGPVIHDVTTRRGRERAREIWTGARVTGLSSKEIESARVAGYEPDGDWFIGRDPRRMTHDELRAMGHEAMSPTAAIKARCLDCAGSTDEVRKLDFRTSQGGRASTSWDFRCWREIENPNIDADFTLAGARTRNAVLLAGQVIKVSFGGISDIPGPVTLLGLVPTDEGGGRWTLDPAYIVNRFDLSKPTTILIPSK